MGDDDFDMSVIYDEINQETAAVAQEHWLSLIQEFVVGADAMADGGVQVPLSQQEAAAMLRTFRRGGDRGDDAQMLLDLERRIDKELEAGPFNNTAGRGCFCKLTDVSPKDLADRFEFERVREVAERRMAEEQEARGGPGWTNNAALQAVLWTKGQLLKCTSGAEVVALMCASERCMDEELARKGYESGDEAWMGRNPVHILLREWVDVDPAFELRGFVSQNRLRGLSQMSSMDIDKVHYPQLLALRDAMGPSVLAFFNTNIKPRLASFAEGLENGAYVIDFYLTDSTDPANLQWKIVEINPVNTSGLGHLFAGADWGPCWQAWNAAAKNDEAAVDVRLHTSTTGDVLEEAFFARHKEVRDYLAMSADCYGE